MPQTVGHFTNSDLDEIVVAEREGVALDVLKEAAGLTPSPIDLLGTWVNIDSHTGGIVKIVLGWTNALQVHAFGACVPNPCDWGVVAGHTYGANVSSGRAIAFSAAYQFNFKSTIVTGSLQGGMLVVEVFDHFTDNSGRYDYYSRLTFRR